MATKTKAKPVEGEIITGELKLPEKETGLLAELQKSGELLDTIEKEWMELPDMDTPEGVALARSRRSELVSMRTGGDKTRKAINAPAQKLIDSVNNLWKTYLPRIAPVEKLYDDAIKKHDAEVEERRAEKRRIKQERLDAIQHRIDAIKLAPIDVDSIEVAKEKIRELEGISANMEVFEEFSEVAQEHIDLAMQKLAEKQQKLEEQEREREAIELQRIENERVQQELAAEREKLAEERRRQEEAAAETERVRLEQEQQAANLKAEQERAQAEREARHKDDMQRILDAANNCQTVEDCIAEHEYLSGLDPVEDFCIADEAIEGVIETAMFDVSTKREALQLKADQDKVREEINAAWEQAYIDDAKREQAKADLEAAENIKPDMKLLKAWAKRLHAAKLPEVSSPEANDIIESYQSALSDVQERLDSLQTLIEDLQQ